MSEVANNEMHESAVELKPAAAEATTEEAAEQVVIDVAAAGDAANAVNASKPTEEEVVSSPKADNKKTPTKRTPSKRMSFIERAQKESEELVKNMGGSLELEGGRRTRSSARGTPTRTAVVSTPPPTKKARTSPANAANITPSRARGRGRKIDIAESAEEPAKKQEQAAESEEESAAPKESQKKKVETGEDQADDEVEETKIANIEQSKEASAKDAGDKTDAPLKTVPEEKQNDVDHVAEEETQKSAEPTKADSPMDTDDQADTENNPASDPATVEQTAAIEDAQDEAAAKAATNVTLAPTATAVSKAPLPVIAKEPTPEPMEVDSSSKSNDVVEITPTAAVAAEKMVKDSNTSAVVAETAAAIVADDTAVAAPAKSEEVVSVAGETATKAVVENCAEAKVASNAIANDADISPAENVNSLERNAITGAESEATVTEAKKDQTAANENKPENDMCEPKIVSPPMNAASENAATTPQFCN